MSLPSSWSITLKSSILWLRHNNHASLKICNSFQQKHSTLKAATVFFKLPALMNIQKNLLMTNQHYKEPPKVCCEKISIMQIFTDGLWKCAQYETGLT